MTIRQTVLAITSILAISTTSFAEDAATFFPIMAWDHVPNDPAVIKKIRECGFTIAGFATPATLDACHAEGLKAIVSDQRCGGYDWTSFGTGR